VLSNSIQQLLLVITNGLQEVHARTLTSVCKSGIDIDVIYRMINILYVVQLVTDVEDWLVMANCPLLRHISFNLS